MTNLRATTAQKRPVATDGSKSKEEPAVSGAAAADAEASQLLYSDKVDQAAINEFDLKAPRSEALFTPPGFLLEPLRALLVDPRDEVMLHFYINMLLVALPLFATFFFVPLLAPSSWLGQLYVQRPKTLGLAYVVLVYALFIKRFNYMLHYSSHRPLFQPTTLGRVLNTMITHVFAPICGVPPGMYHMHHIVMHHNEGNLFPWDLSATMQYQRDSFTQFLGYWLRFFVVVHVQLPYVAFRRHQLKLALVTMANTAFFFSSIYLTSFVNPVFSWYALALPYSITCFLLMFGNWAQHLFVDPKRHESNYGLTYTCINNSHNQCSFNDGYHVLHHINASLHWSQLPSTFTNNFSKFVKEDSLVFEGIDFFMLAVIVFAKQWKFVARFYKHIGSGPAPSTEEIIARLKSLCVPVPAALCPTLVPTPMGFSKWF